MISNRGGVSNQKSLLPVFYWNHSEGTVNKSHSIHPPFLSDWGRSAPCELLSSLCVCRQKLFQKPILWNYWAKYLQTLNKWSIRYLVHKLYQKFWSINKQTHFVSALWNYTIYKHLIWLINIKLFFLNSN